MKLKENCRIELDYRAINTYLVFKVKGVGPEGWEEATGEGSGNKVLRGDQETACWRNNQDSERTRWWGLKTHGKERGEEREYAQQLKCVLSL